MAFFMPLAAAIPALKPVVAKLLMTLGLGAARAAGQRLGNVGRGQSAKHEQGTPSDDSDQRVQELMRQVDEAEARERRAQDRANAATSRAMQAESILADEQRMRRRLARVVLPISVVLAFVAGLMVGWLALSGL